MTEPTPGPTTSAMRLKPSARPAPPLPPRPTVAVLRSRLDAVLELHAAGELVPLCRECLLPHPCPTYVAATGGPTSTDTPEDASP